MLAVEGRIEALSTQPLITAFLTRGLETLADLAAHLEPSSLGEVVGASSNHEMLVAALERAYLDALAHRDPLLPARLRGLKAREALLGAEGGTLSSSQVGELLGISRQAVDKRRRAGRLLGLDTGRRGYSYPAWQLGESGGVLPGLEQTLAALHELSAWSKLRFFLSGVHRLAGATPLAALRRGEVEAVAGAARAFGSHGAV